MAQYVKKPVVIEAIQLTIETFDEIYDWIFHNDGIVADGNKDDIGTYLVILTLEGNHRASKGDYIIKGIQGEFYPCKPDIFEATYERL